MGLIKKASAKKFYSKDVDEVIVKLANEGKSVKEISTEVGHTVASVTYRIYRVLNKHETLDTIKYKA